MENDHCQGMEKLAGRFHMRISICLDLVLVIYAGETMAPYREDIKNMVSYFYENTQARTRFKNLIFRVRIIAYRDAVCDGENALQCTDFFSLPDELDALIDYLDDLSFTGGETHGGNGMDALMRALESDWNDSVPNSQLRHNVMLITDSASVCMNDFQNRICSFYPQNLSADVERISKFWLDQEPLPCHLAKSPDRRMILFAANQSPWKELTELFDQYDNSCVLFAPDGISCLTDPSTLRTICSALYEAICI